MIDEIIEIQDMPVKVSCELHIPDNGRIILVDWGINGRLHTLQVANHNIFRLDKNCQVVWQVTRNEHGKLDWDAMHRHAHEKGFDGCREPFGDFVLKYPDGRTNIDPQTGSPPESAIWELGCIVCVRSFSSQSYELDIETGVAANVTPGRQRRW